MLRALTMMILTMMVGLDHQEDDLQSTHIDLLADAELFFFVLLERSVSWLANANRTNDTRINSVSSMPMALVICWDDYCLSMISFR
jgi:hypothetical protein